MPVAMGPGGDTAPAGGSGYRIPDTGPVTAREIYALLTQKGLSTAQAVGVMANMIAESSLNPESGGTDSNGYYAGGLISWNAESYPNVHQLVTGDPQKDVRAQIDYLLTGTSGIKAGLQGATGADVAGNFAANVEKCEGCTPGSNYPNGWAKRVANAAIVQAWVNGGRWPTSAGTGGAGSGGPGSGGGAGSGSSKCLVTVPVIGSCVLSTSSARALIGGGLILVSLPVGLIGAVVLVALGFRRTGAGAAIGRSAEAAGAGIAFVPGLQGAGAAVAAAGSAEARSSQRSAADRSARRQAAQDRHDEAEYRRARARGTRASSTAPPPPELDPAPF